MKIGVHITHEAVQKIGGIGSVLNGLCSSDRYKNFFNKTLLYGPLFYNPGDIFSKLGKGGKVFYSNRDYYDEDNYENRFKPIIDKYNINIIYGKRILSNEFNPLKSLEVDILLVDINGMNKNEIDIFKYKLWERFKLESIKFESDWDYEQYLRIGIPYVELLQALYGESNEFYHFSHEFMGIISCLSTLLKPSFYKSKTIYYAHEISPVRSIIEKIEGHDISFYLKMEEDKKNNVDLLQRYPQQSENPRTILIKKTTQFDLIYAVSDLVRDEYIYLNPEIDKSKVKVVYNGIPIKFIEQREKEESRNILIDYCKNLFNFEPDFIFTHVARMVPSKAFYRDFTFLFELDEIVKSAGGKGFFLLLSSLIGTGRDSSQIFNMEKEYGWPVYHKEGWPDLVGMEIEINSFLEVFNEKSKAIKGIFINQFGFSRRKCGFRVSEKAEFLHFRVGSDAEIGFSIYEPFGIAQLETIPFGGFSFLSTSCGAFYLLKCSFNNEKGILPFIGFDFIGEGHLDLEKNKIDPLSLNKETRFLIERRLFNKMANIIFNVLPKNNQERFNLLFKFQSLSNKLGWEAITENVIKYLT
ncbi:MAG: hypothetical protein N3A58_05305 [Spirochaetes bacterium]|nr:hypothetical protein [Spirochaetota bacterium]